VKEGGFLRMSFRCLHKWPSSTEKFVPLFELQSSPDLTVSSRRDRIGGLMSADATFVRTFWAAGGSRHPPPLCFSGSVIESELSFDPDEWRTDFGRFRTDSARIDWEGHDQVFGAVDSKTGAVIALKRTDLTKFTESSQDFRRSHEFREVELLIRLNHPCIESIVGLDSGERTLEIGTEFVENGSLDRVLDARRTNHPIPEWFDVTGIAINIFGMVLGLRHFHDRGVIHRHFKPSKVLIANLLSQFLQFCCGNDER
jgi:hypothetical protein